MRQDNTKNQLPKHIVTNRNLKDERCTCKDVSTYKQNWAGIYVCTECNKKLPDNKIRDICSYYGW